MKESILRLPANVNIDLLLNRINRITMNAEQYGERPDIWEHYHYIVDNLKRTLDWFTAKSHNLIDLQHIGVGLLRTCGFMRDYGNTDFTESLLSQEISGLAVDISIICDLMIAITDAEDLLTTLSSHQREALLQVLPELSAFEGLFSLEGHIEEGQYNEAMVKMGKLALSYGSILGEEYRYLFLMCSK
jgi:hypothetical protein